MLPDECVDRRLGADITGHEVRTVPEMGWSGRKNGELLGIAQHEFDVFVTTDRNLPFQQHLRRFSIAVIVLRPRSTDLAALRQLVPSLMTALPTALPGEAVFVGS